MPLSVTVNLTSQKQFTELIIPAEHPSFGGYPKEQICDLRIYGLVLSALLVVGMAGCSKKEQTAQTPPADQSAQTAQSRPLAQRRPGQSESAQRVRKVPRPQRRSSSARARCRSRRSKRRHRRHLRRRWLFLPVTSLVVRLGSTLDTKTAQAGQPFNGTLARSVVVGGEVAIPAGAGVSGSVVDSKSPGKFKGEGVLSITLNSINVGGVPQGDRDLYLYPDR